MGTRGLTAVVLDGEYKVAQYGQWDHYPTGQGVTALNFCRRYLQDPKKASQFLTNVSQCRWVTESEIAAANRLAGVSGEWMTFEQAKVFESVLPNISRGVGAKILERIAQAADPPLLKNDIEFAADSLFCEYAYVVDLDKWTFEIYKGFNSEALKSGERFFSTAKDPESEYYPVRHWMTFPLSELPTKSRFIKLTVESDDED